VRLPPPTCWAGPQFVQVGAFAETERVRRATAQLAGLHAIRTEPVFVRERAALRVRLGPAADRAQAAALLAKVRARGYGEAVLVPADPRAPAVRC
jgi:cell division septation protein DedD